MDIMLIPSSLEISFQVIFIFLSFQALPMFDGFSSSDVSFIFGYHHDSTFAFFSIL
jgi:hypothetical protein